MKLSSYDLERYSESQGTFRPEVYYIVVYPCGDAKALTVVQAQDNDVPEYSVASRYWFTYESHANSYAKALADKHGLTYQGEYGQLLD